ncbi:MAG: leucyl/phenylalanyl-tRNA--protein transferase [Alphaproteobacteria bacterium]|nr:leucyl/phenylalanyl-tRNA--protein transferase [Alphaproteobacteria bacterium]
MPELTPELLLRAYAHGYFPMAESRDDPELFWLDPEMRGILPLDRFHVSRRLARTIRSNHFEVRVDTAFEQVMRACAAPRPGHGDSWINARIISLYTALFDQGHGHSVECWREGVLAGGIYGIQIGAAFFGESMFSVVRDASKVALTHLAARLRAGGFLLFDTQFLTPHLAHFGGEEIPRDRYLHLLRRAINSTGDFYSLPDPCGGNEVLQSITQTS